MHRPVAFHTSKTIDYAKVRSYLGSQGTETEILRLAPGVETRPFAQATHCHLLERQRDYIGLS